MFEKWKKKAHSLTTSSSSPIAKTFGTDENEYFKNKGGGEWAVVEVKWMENWGKNFIYLFFSAAKLGKTD